MAAPKMHADEIDTDVALVRRLLAGQFPQWADLAIDPVVSYGTDHDIYRLGEHLAARLPCIGWATDQATKEAEWLPKLAPHLPLAVPVQLAMGQPAEGYPYEWSVYEWLPGENANGTIDDLDQAAVDLAAFVNALRQIDTTDAHLRLVVEEHHSRKGTNRFVSRSQDSATESTAMPPSSHGRSRSTLRYGKAKRSGCTATCCQATCSSSTAACRRSSTSGASTWAIRLVTCNPPGTSSRARVARGTDPSSTSTKHPGCEAAAGRSARRSWHFRITGTPTPA
jgi:hypothetical protein